MHLQEGAIKQYFQNKGKTLTREQLTNNTTIVMKQTDNKRLDIAESIYIMESNPQINKQNRIMEGTLKLFGWWNEEEW